MRFGIGLPNTLGLGGALTPEWARRAESSGQLTTFGVLDRVVYDSLDPFVSLAAAAAVTSRVTLVTMVVIGPLRPTALLAKEAASLDALSGGRLVLGLSIGARLDDYDVPGVPHRGRGVRLAEQLMELRDCFEDGRLGPATARPEGPPVLAGGLSGESFGRMARWSDGYVHGGGPPRAFASAAAKARVAWADLRRPGVPQLWGQGYFALGDAGTLERGAAYLRDYYAFTGPFAERIVAANLVTPQAIIDFVRGYEEAGCDQLVLLPTVAELEQVDRLADVLSHV